MISSHSGATSHRCRNISTAIAGEACTPSSSEPTAELACSGPTHFVHSVEATEVTTNPASPILRPSPTSGHLHSMRRSSSGPLPRSTVASTATPAASRVGTARLTSRPTGGIGPPPTGLNGRTTNTEVIRNTASTRRNAPNPQRCGGASGDLGARAGSNGRLPEKRSDPEKPGSPIGSGWCGGFTGASVEPSLDHVPGAPRVEACAPGQRPVFPRLAVAGPAVPPPTTVASPACQVVAAIR